MKKSFFTMGLLAMAVASCTNEEVVDMPASKGISFNNPYVGTSVRAVDAIETNLGMLQKADSGFYAYGGYETVTDVFNKTHVTYNSGAWEYSPVNYWVVGEKYKFITYAPDMSVTPTFNYGEGTASNNATLVFIGVTVNGTKANQKDFVIGKSDVITAKETGNPKIGITMKHALAMVKVTLTDKFRSGVDCKITNFAINGLKTTGTFTSNANVDPSENAGSWTVTGAAEETSTFTDNGVELKANGQTYVNEFIVLPQKVTADAVTVTFTGALYDADGKPIAVPGEDAETDGLDDTTGAPVGEDGTDAVKNQKQLTIKIPAITWAVNSRYHYTADIDGNTFDMNEIIFGDIEVGEWGNYSDTPVTIE